MSSEPFIGALRPDEPPSESIAPEEIEPLHRQNLRLAAERIATTQRLLITCHRGPDGDSVGSMIALAALRHRRGVRTVLYSPDHVPRRFRGLPYTRTFTRKLTEEHTFDATVVVDCADRELLGKDFPGPEVTGEMIVLDHHRTSEPFGDIHVCDPDASSVGVLVARIARLLEWPLSRDAATGIYVSLASDTGSFRYANTNAEALHLAAHLVECGVQPWSVSERLYERASLKRYKLLSLLLDTMTLELNGKVAVLVLTRELLARAGASWDDSTDLVNYARAIDGVECGLLLSPAKYGGIRVSMRSKGRAVDAGAICASMGGGGHRGAAGCVVQGEWDEVRSTVLAALARALEPAEKLGDANVEGRRDLE